MVYFLRMHACVKTVFGRESGTIPFPKFCTMVYGAVHDPGRTNCFLLEVDLAARHSVDCGDVEMRREVPRTTKCPSVETLL